MDRVRKKMVEGQEDVVQRRAQGPQAEGGVPLQVRVERQEAHQREVSSKLKKINFVESK